LRYFCWVQYVNQFHRLPFHSTHRIFWCTEILKCDVLLLLAVLWVSYQRDHCQVQCHKAFPQEFYSFESVLRSLTHLELSLTFSMLLSLSLFFLTQHFLTFPQVCWFFCQIKSITEAVSCFIFSSKISTWFFSKAYFSLFILIVFMNNFSVFIWLSVLF
jgi:hypothetical protein